MQCLFRFALDDVVTDLSDNNCFQLASSSSFLLLLQFVIFIASCFVFGMHIPEKVLPGTHFGYSVASFFINIVAYLFAWSYLPTYCINISLNYSSNIKVY